MSLQINGKSILVDNEGYLLDPQDWNEEIALKIAELEKIDMTSAHWCVVRYIRESYEKNHCVPEARHALKNLKNELGAEKATRKFLYQLFPYGYGQQACKIAGTRKPLKLMLDV